MDLNTIDFDALRIRIYPDPVLRQVAEPVQRITPALHELVERMIDLMVEAHGIGLAAPQVGLPIRVVVVSLTGKQKDAEVFINPELEELEGWSETEEGCLSVPGVRALVRRPAVCALNAYDLDGTAFRMDATDLAATAFQHETDHLDGTLFIDRLSQVSRIAVRNAVRDLESQYQSGQ